MRLTARLVKLETALIAGIKEPYREALEQDFRDWITHDPQAKEILQREYKYCVSKGYPTLDTETLDFYERLEDPVFHGMIREQLAAFDQYLRTRRAV